MLLKFNLNASIFPIANIILLKLHVCTYINNTASLQQFFDHNFCFLNCRIEIFPEGKHILQFMYPENT